MMQLIKSHALPKVAAVAGGALYFFWGGQTNHLTPRSVGNPPPHCLLGRSVGQTPPRLFVNRQTKVPPHPRRLSVCPPICPALTPSRLRAASAASPCISSSAPAPCFRPIRSLLLSANGVLKQCSSHILQMLAFNNRTLTCPGVQPCRHRS